MTFLGDKCKKHPDVELLPIYDGGMTLWCCWKCFQKSLPIRIPIRIEKAPQ